MIYWLLILAAVWVVGTWARVYRQARYFQIEEYMNGRYLRWCARDFTRIFPLRAVIMLAFGAGLALIPMGSSQSRMPAVIAILIALIAVWPPDEGVVKKPFRRTGRATRLLGAAFAVTLFDIALYSFLISLLDVAAFRWQVIALSLAGFVLYFSAPLILVSGNILMMPVEALLRRRFIGAARGVMRQLQPTVIGITGSYGKTTTKNFVSEILNGRYKAYATPKSYNTMMGVCLAINNDLKDDYSVDYFVVEMGAYVRGEIARICALTPPDISIVTAVGPQHLERFGSLENIQTAKYEIIRHLPPDGVGVFNWDNEYVRAMMDMGYPQTRIGVSYTASPDDPDAPRFIAEDVKETLDGLSFTVIDRETGERERFQTAVIGLHNVTNILLATAVGVHAGLSLRDVAFRVRGLKMPESRLARHTAAGGITVINDGYSANPDGIVSALRVLALHQTGRRVLVTPGMIELADLHYKENERLGRLAAEHATDVILVGATQTQPIHDGLTSAGFDGERLQVVNALHEAVTWIERNLQAGDTVLFLNDLPDTY
ncbi:MAG: UDP-N-acetylmuramoyl-tripeptide--D-alanyl-D-alanine ligase [Anaerolineaceae bacterium]|nr:MAG: UDP-N-acetylmuramoyl-tripeptide--D-alanyl-D-alanine ligase [Anaerolineaceae bacterium]